MTLTRCELTSFLGPDRGYRRFFGRVVGWDTIVVQGSSITGLANGRSMDSKFLRRSRIDCKSVKVDVLWPLPRYGCEDLIFDLGWRLI